MTYKPPTIFICNPSSHSTLTSNSYNLKILRHITTLHNISTYTVLAYNVVKVHERRIKVIYFDQ